MGLPRPQPIARPAIRTARTRANRAARPERRLHARGREVHVAKYGAKAKRKVARAMRKRKKGTLKSGSGRKVKSKKQAIAIGLSEARKKGAKAPKRKKGRKKRL